MKFQENLLTHHYINDSYETIYNKYNEFLETAKVEGANKKDSTLNQLKLNEIKLNLATANKQYYSKKYQEALKTYQITQGLVFQLLYPPFNPHYTLHPKFEIAVKAEMFEPMLKTSLQIVTAIPPEGVEYLSINGKGLSNEVKESVKPFTETGVNFSDVPAEVRDLTQLGLEHSKQQNWDTAETYFTKALEILENTPETEEGKIAKASVQLNLGAILVQKGKTAEAKRSLNAAAKGFELTNDKVGLAQAKLNIGAAFAKEGKPNEALVMIKEAESLLDAEEGNAGGDDLTPDSGGGIANPLRSLLSRSTPAVSPSVFMSPSMASFSTKAIVMDSVIEPGTSIKPDAIYDLIKMKGSGVIYRLPNKGEGWLSQEFETNVEKQQKTFSKELGVVLDNEVVKFKWSDKKTIDSDEVKNSIYSKRINSTVLSLVNNWTWNLADFALNLPHLYMYQLPVCIGDCYHQLGEYEKALKEYSKASTYQFINTTIEVPSLWIKMARNYLLWGNSLYKNEEAGTAADVYVNVIKLEGGIDLNSPLYKDKLNIYGDQVKVKIIDDIPNAAEADLNPDVISIVLEINNRLKMIKAGLDFSGFPANFFPIFKFDFLQGVATYFAQQAIQAEREYISFTSKAEDEQMTRQQLEQAVEQSKAQIELAEKQVEYAEAELEVNKENAELADMRLQNAIQHKQTYADVSYEITALDAASVFASGPEGYKVSYTYYSPSEGKNVTLSGSDAYKVMEDAAWKKGMLSRKLELENLQNNIEELTQNKALAQAQQAAAQVNVEVAQQQKKIAEMNKKHSQELLNSFESQVFTPEVWFQLGNRMLWISKSYLYNAIGVAKKMQQAYELETGFKLKAIKSDYTTNIVSGLLSADYLLQDINYFTIHQIYNSKAKDVPVKQTYSLAELNPTGFETTFKETGIMEFETSLADFDRGFPGSYLRKIKKVEIVVEGLIPPSGVQGKLRNSGISRDRKKNGDIYFRLQPTETMFLSNYSPRADVVIFQPDEKVLGVFENCGVATGWTIEILPNANDLDYQTISDIKMVVYYTAQFDVLLEKKIKALLPATGENSTVLPFRLLFPDEFFGFMDSGQLDFSLYSSDFAFNQTDLKVLNVALRVVMEEGVSAQGRTFEMTLDGATGKAATNAEGIIKSDKTVAANPLNALIGKEVAKDWSIKLPDADNPGFDKTKIKDLFLFIEYSFKYKGM